VVGFVIAISAQPIGRGQGARRCRTGGVARVGVAVACLDGGARDWAERRRGDDARTPALPGARSPARQRRPPAV